MRSRIHAAFLSEGVHSHGALQGRLADALDGHDDIIGSFGTVPSPGRFEFQLVRPIRPLGALDFQALRWRVRWSCHARRMIKRIYPPPDVLFVNTQSCALAMGALMGRIPTVLSVDATGCQFARLEYWRPHGQLAAIEEAPLQALERRALQRATVIVAWTEWAATSLRDDYGIDPARIVTLNPGVDVKGLVGSRRPRPTGAPLRLLFVGNDLERKGFHRLLAAVAVLEGPVVIDVVTGDHVEPNSGVQVHRGLRAGSPEMLSVFAAADVFVLPTKADAAPWVVLEAMAAGLPVVSTRVGAIPELVGTAGLLVASDDTAGLADALRRLKADAGLRARLGQQGRARVTERYDAAAQMPRLLDVVRAAAAGAA